MTEQAITLTEAKSIILKMIGLKAWGVKLGIGTYITIEFGKPKENHGEWHLWIYDCSWQIAKGTKILTNSNAPRLEMESQVQLFESLILKDIRIEDKSWNTIFEFENALSLKVIASVLAKGETFMIFVPDERVISFGPASNLTVESDP